VDKQNYTVLKSKETKEEFLSAFLANTQEEAVEVYNEFLPFLNSIVSRYLSTGLEKSDLFSTALVGLARAMRDFDSKRSDSLKMFVSFKVKDALRRFVRKNISPVSIPQYIMASHALVAKMQCSQDQKILSYEESTGEPFYTYSDNHVSLTKAAKRCGLSVEQLIERSETLPTSVPYTDDIPDTEQSGYLKTFINELKSNMNENELIVSNGILRGDDYTKIARDSGKSKTWVTNVINDMREKFKSS